MDQYFYVIREERCNVAVQKPIIRYQQHEDLVKLMTRSDGFPELYHLDMPTHQYSAPHRQVHVCQGPVAAQVQKRVFVPPQCQDEKVFYYPGNHPTQPPPRQMKKPALETVIDSNEAARLYGGILIKDFGRNKLPIPAIRF